MAKFNENILLGTVAAMALVLAPAGQASAAGLSGIAGAVAALLPGSAGSPAGHTESVTVCLDDPTQFYVLPRNVSDITIVKSSDPEKIKVVEVPTATGISGLIYSPAIQFSGDPGDVMTCTFTFVQ